MYFLSSEMSNRSSRSGRITGSGWCTMSILSPSSVRIRLTLRQSGSMAGGAPRVVGPLARHGQGLGPLLELLQGGQRVLELLLAADDADQVVHRLLELGVHLVRRLADFPRERLERLGDGRVQVGLRGDRLGRAQRLQVVRRAVAGPLAEHQQVG